MDLYQERRKKWLGHGEFAKQTENVKEERRKEQITVVPRTPHFIGNTSASFARGKERKRGREKEGRK